MHYKKYLLIVLSFATMIAINLPLFPDYAIASIYTNQITNKQADPYLQFNLSTLGSSPLITDKSFAPRTKIAISMFETVTRLAVDGIVGRNKYIRLHNSLQPIPTPSSVPDTGFYIVEHKDSLFTISQQFGIPIADLMSWNRLSSTIIQPGQTIYLIPPSSQQRETVDPGEGQDNKQTRPIVLGYYPEYYVGDTLAFDSLKNYHQTITDVVAFGYTVNAEGEVNGRHFIDGMKFAKQKGIRTHALVHNYMNGGFDQQAASKLLNSPTARQKAVDQIHTLLKTHNYSGVHLDLENIAPGDRNALTQFVKEVRDRLHPVGYQVSMAVPAKTSDSPNASWSGAFDYAALGKLVDEIAIMTYDQHYLDGSPGPIASYPWVERVITYATSQLPNEKILLGIATYGYEWGPNGGERALSHPRVASLLHSLDMEATWNPQYQVPMFTYQKEGQAYHVWFENSHSARIKFHLVNQYRLRGIAIWRLGFEDPELWETIDRQILNQNQ